MLRYIILLQLYVSNIASQTSETERLEPTPQDLTNFLQQARSYWHGLSQHAIVSYGHGIPPQTLAQQDLLKRVPSIPDNRVHHHCHVPLDTVSSNGVLYLKAQATWEVPKGNDCDACGKQKMRVAAVPIGVQRPTTLYFGNDVFSLDLNEKSGPGLQHNMMSVLVLDWLYISSAEMLDWLLLEKR